MLFKHAITSSFFNLIASYMCKCYVGSSFWYKNYFNVIINGFCMCAFFFFHSLVTSLSHSSNAVGDFLSVTWVIRHKKAWDWLCEGVNYRKLIAILIDVNVILKFFSFLISQCLHLVSHQWVLKHPTPS